MPEQRDLWSPLGPPKRERKSCCIEKGNYGGDCTNFGCIPSKSLIASAKAAHILKENKTFGLDFTIPFLNAKPSLDRVRGIVEEVRSHEDSSALAKMGVATLTGTAIFKNAHIIAVDGQEVFGKKIVIAAGSSPYIPSIAGLEKSPYLTNETVFDLQEVPISLAVLGGGPIGCELAQAFQRIGSRVTLIHSHARLLGREEESAQTLLAEQFQKEGISLQLDAKVLEVSYQNEQFHIRLENGALVVARALLVATGRRPNVNGMNLEAAAVHYSEKGIPVDVYGRTNQKHIWAVGDITGTPYFTHWAENQARSVLTSLLLPFKRKSTSNRFPA